MTGGSADIYRDDDLITHTSNSGFYTDIIGAKGGGTYVYKVCAGGNPAVCSNVDAVVF